MSIEYTHSENLHTLAGPASALPILFETDKPKSLLDVGCGGGTWMQAALNIGIYDVVGVDGVQVPESQLKVPIEKIEIHNLMESWDLNKKFDTVLCLEVAEHLDCSCASTLIDALVRHGNLIYFSAAAPGQPGQHHVNCQWPVYWQKLFNDRGFVCDDKVRWKLWDASEVEPWYRQNMFTARFDINNAGKEPRIPSVIHPELLPWLQAQSHADVINSYVVKIQEGCLPLRWYLEAPVRAYWAKILRNIR